MSVSLISTTPCGRSRIWASADRGEIGRYAVGTRAPISRIHRTKTILKGDLHSARKGLEMLADLRRPRGIQLVHHAGLELHLEPDPVVRIPAERRAEDLLVAAKDTAGLALR